MLKLKGQNINYLHYDICRSVHILCPNVAGFLKNVLKRQKKAHLKKKN